MRLAHLALCSILTLAAAAYGQAAKPASPKSAATFSTTSRNVVLDVIVTDRSGNPIHGLKSNDFTVLENGTAQHVKGFEEHRPDEPSAKAPVPVQLPPDTYTNYVSSAEPGAVNIILFDSLNTDRLNLTQARQQLLSYLTKLPDNTRVALFTLDGELHLVHGFTDDNHALVEAAQQLSSSPNPIMRKARDVSDELADARLTKITSNPQMYGALSRFLWDEYDSKSRVTHRHHHGSAQSASAQHGDFSRPQKPDLDLRRNSVRPHRHGSTDAEDGCAAGRNADRGVPRRCSRYCLAGSRWSRSNSQDVFGPRGGDYGERSGQGEELSLVHETMLEIAQLTGGRAYFNNNDIPGQIEDIVQSGSSYYTLAYRPYNQEWNGKFRKVSVKTSHPNVKVRSSSRILRGERPLRLAGHRSHFLAGDAARSTSVYRAGDAGASASS